MGVVIDFPKDRAAFRVHGTTTTARHCEVVILPVIRIDRYEDKPLLRPARGQMTSSKRRKRASRS
jgi:hypothetical protein